ncbi:hypothetical protein RDI58_028825 [Solanum bulbocastanum]|uniref:Phospholipase A1 n=1 Tax=Solanum bulbocastanum TaxID=147425 RepID=A0AAN8STD6_SOLBU
MVPHLCHFLILSLQNHCQGKHGVKESNFIGYIAVATDEDKVSRGRRDIVIAWRGTIQTLEWVNDLQFLLIPGPEVFGKGGLLPLVHHGFYNTYTSESAPSKFNQASARDQVEKHNGMVKQEDGKWILMDCEEYEF